MMNDKELKELLKMQKEVAMLNQKINAFIANYTVRTHDVTENQDVSLESKPDIEKVVTELLISLGIPTSLSGFRYIRLGIIMMLKNSESERMSITKTLYPKIAEHFDTTGSRVERCVRHAVNVAYVNQKNNEILREMIKHSGRSCPTNSEFLAFIAEKIRLES